MYLCSLTAALHARVTETFLSLSLQLSAGEQRGPARRRLSHLPVGGEGADQTLQRPQLFSSGGKKKFWKSVAHFHAVSTSNTLCCTWSVKDSNQVRKKEKKLVSSRTWSTCFALFKHAVCVHIKSGSCLFFFFLQTAQKQKKWRDMK